MTLFPSLCDAEISTLWLLRYPLLVKMPIKIFLQTIRDWNDLPGSLFTSAEMSDDCVSKFTFLLLLLPVNRLLQLIEDYAMFAEAHGERSSSSRILS